MGMTGLRALWPAAAVFAVDQLAKGLVVALVTGPLAVAPFLNIVLVHNTGAAFGFLNRTGGWSNILFMVIAVVVSVIIVRKLRGPTGRDPQVPPLCQQPSQPGPNSHPPPQLQFSPMENWQWKRPPFLHFYYLARRQR